MKNIKDKLAKLTLADAAAILVVIAIIAALAYLFFRKSTLVTVTIKVNEDNIAFNSWDAGNKGTRSWFAQMFYPGMKEKDGLGKATAEVLGLRSYDTSPARKAVYLNVRLRTVYNRASNQNYYKGKAVLVGSTIKLYLDSLQVDGLITHVEGAKDLRQKITLILETQVRDETPVYPETSGTKPYIADALAEGQEIKDDQGNTIIKILKKRVEDAQRVVTTSDGRVFLQTNPLRKDVFFTLQVSANQLANRYYIFDDVPILIGTGIPINTATISVWPEVTKIQPKEN